MDIKDLCETKFFLVGTRRPLFLLSTADHNIPAGCGKRTVVKYVAHQLGLHVVEYSCHNLVASSERKTSAALAQAFSTANRYFGGQDFVSLYIKRATRPPVIPGKRVWPSQGLC